MSQPHLINNDILVIDCAGDNCGLLLATSKDDYYSGINSKHITEELIPTIEKACQSQNIKLSDIQIIGWNRGPGSFTSLRIAAAVIQGLSTPYKIKIVGFSAFDFWLTKLDLTNQKVICAIDARCQEVYWGIYQFNQNSIDNYRIEKDLAVDSPNIVLDYLDKNKPNIDIAIGNGFEIYPDLEKTQLPKYFIPNHLEQLRAIAKKIQTIPKAIINNKSTLPLYIRKKVAKTIKEQNVY